MSYPHVEASLYFADAALYGPHSLDRHSQLPLAKGGGGTDFRPFFDAITLRRSIHKSVAVYLTDGYGSFPAKPPHVPVLWLVIPGGRDNAAFPFGKVVRMV